jgi:Glycosyltransferase like family
MISLIICNKDPAKFTAVKAMYAAAFGDTPWELLAFHDAKSLCEGYNRGIARSKGHTVIFSHDDLEIISPDFPQRVAGHLENFDVFGLAGTNRVVNGLWTSAGPPYIFGQVAHTTPDGKIGVCIYGAPRRAVGKIQALDGVMIVARRSVLARIAFDAVTFDAFHLYDMDFSYQCYYAGLRVGVVNDINVLHASGGNYDNVWLDYAQRFARKWKLPPLPAPAFNFAAVMVDSRRQALEVMNPSYWDEE